MKTKEAMQARIVALEVQLKEAKAVQIHNLHFAAHALRKVSTDKLFASGIVLEMSFLGGKPVFDPVMIADGLSNETIACLIKDMERAFKRATELQPK